MKLLVSWGNSRVRIMIVYDYVHCLDMRRNLYVVHNLVHVLIPCPFSLHPPPSSLSLSLSLSLSIPFSLPFSFPLPLSQVL